LVCQKLNIYANTYSCFFADYGTNEKFIESAREKYLSIQKNSAKRVSGDHPTQSFVVKSSFIDPTGMNVVVVEGLRKHELENFSEVVNVFPDLPVYTTAYSWGVDRIDQPSLPLSSTYTPAFKGCGVDIYIIDTGIDTNHIEFSPTGLFRTVANIFNEFGELTSNTDVYGHGTHCAGKLVPIDYSSYC
jgi:subtilisin family serine protease